MIHESGTFEYAAEFTKEGFSNSDIVLRGTNLGSTKQERMLGPHPKIRFWNERLVLISSGIRSSSCRNVSFPVGEAVKLLARAGDQLFLVRTGSGGMGLSLVRQENLILAIGAITSVPLGADIQTISALDIDPPNFATYRPLELSVKGEPLTLRPREVLETGGYHIYVERCRVQGAPGTDECVSLCFTDNVAIKTAAIRSAILLAHGNLKMVSWTSSDNFYRL